MAFLPAAETGGAPPRLPLQQFLEVVERTPLVSIDLIVLDPAGRVLLGWRRNAPARDCWFVPGGCIRKTETLDAAFTRIARDELGLAARRREARFVGVYEHIYPDNTAGQPGFGTHYVVLGHELRTSAGINPPPEQHSRYRWFEPAELLSAHDVHENTKAYFRAEPD